MLVYAAYCREAFDDLCCDTSSKICVVLFDYFSNRISIFVTLKYSGPMCAIKGCLIGQPMLCFICDRETPKTT